MNTGWREGAVKSEGDAVGKIYEGEEVNGRVVAGDSCGLPFPLSGPAQ